LGGCHGFAEFRDTVLAGDRLRGAYRPLDADEHVEMVADLVQMTPPQLL
jgi:hypothetical protein